MAYVTLADIKQYLNITGTSDDDLLRDLINNAEVWINGETNRTFEAATATRYYGSEIADYHDSSIVHIKEDLLSITTLLNGDASATEIVAASYWLLDRNDGPPYHGIKLTDTSGVSWQWDTDGWISITGAWGYATHCPEDIRQAALRLASFYYRQKDSQVFDTTAMPEQGVIVAPAGVPKDVMLIIKRYKRYL